MIKYFIQSGAKMEHFVYMFINSNYLSCIYQVIELSFLDFDLEYESSCLYDSLTIYDSDNTELGRFCGSRNPPTLTSKSNTITVVFDADNHQTDDKGFRLRYRIDRGRC